MEAEELLQAARAIANAETQLEMARKRYETVFERIVASHKSAAPPVPKAALDAAALAFRGRDDTVERRVYRFLHETRETSDSQTNSIQTGIPFNTVRWALVQLTKKKFAVNVARGKYRAAVEEELGGVSRE